MACYKKIFLLSLISFFGVVSAQNIDPFADTAVVEQLKHEAYELLSNPENFKSDKQILGSIPKIQKKLKYNLMLQKAVIDLCVENASFASSLSEVVYEFWRDLRDDISTLWDTLRIHSPSSSTTTLKQLYNKL